MKAFLAQHACSVLVIEFDLQNFFHDHSLPLFVTAKLSVRLSINLRQDNKSQVRNELGDFDKNPLEVVNERIYA